MRDSLRVGAMVMAMLAGGGAALVLTPPAAAAKPAAAAGDAATAARGFLTALPPELRKAASFPVNSRPGKLRAFTTTP